jgi:hypothetical protein
MDDRWLVGAFQEDDSDLYDRGAGVDLRLYVTFDVSLPERLVGTRLISSQPSNMVRQEGSIFDINRSSLVTLSLDQLLMSRDGSDMLEL